MLIDNRKQRIKFMTSPIFHPGREVAIRIFDMGYTLSEFADIKNVSWLLFYEISSGERDITDEIAVILAKAFDTTPEYWIEQQQLYDCHHYEKI